jgi:hypothetical protein
LKVKGIIGGSAVGRSSSGEQLEIVVANAIVIIKK